MQDIMGESRGWHVVHRGAKVRKLWSSTTPQLVIFLLRTDYGDNDDNKEDDNPECDNEGPLKVRLVRRHFGRKAI
jgi:hypothetical protein